MNKKWKYQPIWFIRRSTITSDVFVLARFNNAVAPVLSISQFCKSRAERGEKEKLSNNW